MAAIAILTIILAYYYGLNRQQADVLPALQQAQPAADRFTPLSNTMFTAHLGGEVIGYVSIGTAGGYGGPLALAVSVDKAGTVTGYAIIDQKETPVFLQQVQRSNYKERLVGKSFKDPIDIDEDIDRISGATVTSQAIAEAVRKATRQVASERLNLPVEIESPPKIKFGLPELTLLALFALGFFAHRRRFKFTKQARWISLIIGLLVLGFWLNRPLTIANINQLLLGYWPAWQTNLYWYILIGGVLFVFTADNKNPYCEWFCPFGAAQECMGVLGDAKVRSAGKFKAALKWGQRGLAWLAIVLALVFRNPGLSSYEVFGTLFDLVGSTFQFAVLGIVMISSLFIKRPWCTYLCPLRPVDEFIRMVRRWLVELWKTGISKV
jgi:uncharacterized protein with FMN-binding domain